MKHLFIVHSNISYLAALGTICAENLNLEDVVITSRIDLEIKEPVPVIHLPFVFDKKHPWDWWVLQPYRYVDKFIEKYIGENSFIAYLEIMEMSSKLFISSPQCIGYHFIEEGASAHVKGTVRSDVEYNDFNTPAESLRYMGVRDRLKSVIFLLSGMSMRNLTLPFFYDAYFRLKDVRFYGFGEDSFKEAHRKVEISFANIINRFSMPQKFNFNNSSIWLGICCNEAGIDIPIIDYISGIERKCIPHLISNNVKKVFVKHHPRATLELREQEIGVFEKAGIEVVVIEDKVCMELELLGRKNVSIYMLQTSLFYYARQMGHDKIYSIANCFPDYMDRCALDDMWSSVIML